MWQRQHLLSGDGELETWEKRAIQYWALQGRKYGWVIDLEDTETVIHDNMVVSRAVVAKIIPGRRISDTEWRIKNNPEAIAKELGFVTT